MDISENELEDLLIRSGLTFKSEIEDAKNYAKERGVSFGNALLIKGLLSEEDLRRMEAQILGIQFIDLKEKKLSFDNLSIIPEPVCREQNFVVYDRNGENVYVAFLEPGKISESQIYLDGYKLNPRITDAHSIRHALLIYQNGLKERYGNKIQDEAKKIASQKDKKDPNDLLSKKSAINIIDSLIKHAVFQGASDIHLEVGENMLLVRYRIKGVLRDAMVLPKSIAPLLQNRIKMLANLSLEAKSGLQDGRFKANIDGENLSLRVLTLNTALGDKILIRVSREHAEGFTLESLGFHSQALEQIHDTIRKKDGLIIISGPKSSGKTTTLYTMLDILNVPSVSLATAEEKVEYKLSRVVQVQTKSKVGFNLSEAVRAILKQDPDIIMIGDIPDRATANSAITASLSGRLVIASIEANSASDAIEKLIKFDVDKNLLALSLKLVISQRLCKRLNSPGLIGLMEVMTVGVGVGDLIRKKSSGKDIEAEAIKYGFKTLKDEIKIRVDEGIISQDEAEKI